MCGRYTLQVSNRPTLKTLGLPLADRFNIAPQSPVLVINPDGDYEIKPWDYSPAWAREPMHITNARSETLREKPAFRKADRCVFVADGWFEWQRRGDHKQPWYHHLDGALLFLAGICSRNGGCAIVTRPALHQLADIHHRQPVLLEERAISHWLEGHDLFASGVTHQVRCHPVSRRVNKPDQDDPKLLEAIRLESERAVEKPDTPDLFSH